MILASALPFSLDLTTLLTHLGTAALSYLVSFVLHGRKAPPTLGTDLGTEISGPGDTERVPRQAIPPPRPSDRH